MRTLQAKDNYCLLHDNGKIHYPFSKFLTNQYDNLHTQELVAQSLRVLYRFLSAHEIELADRAVQATCLTRTEIDRLAGLCYRPLPEIESLTDKKVVSITSAASGRKPKNLPRAVTANTANRRLEHIAIFLDYFLETFLLPNLRRGFDKRELQQEYKSATDILRSKIKGTKQSHHLDIQSLPSDRFLEIIRTIFLSPEKLFLTDAQKLSRTWQRDRAIALLACEGLRPGTVGNLSLVDIRQKSKHIVIKDNRHLHDKVSTGTAVLKLGASTLVNSASETMIEVWPITMAAVDDYLTGERQTIVSKGLRNQSRGFLFLSETGKSIRHRSSITRIFNRLGRRLNELGMLAVGDDPYFKGAMTYDFYAYVLRHSNASLFVEIKGTSDGVLDTMKSRYGWTKDSQQPARYAARALSDQANIDIAEFNRKLLEELELKKAKAMGSANV